MRIAAIGNIHFFIFSPLIYNLILHSVASVTIESALHSIRILLQTLADLSEGKAKTENIM